MGRRQCSRFTSYLYLQPRARRKSQKNLHETQERRKATRERHRTFGQFERHLPRQVTKDFKKYDSIPTLKAIEETIQANLRNVEIHVYSDPNAAFVNISEHNGNDLILIGCSMLEMNGKQLFNNLRQAGTRTPVCFFSKDANELADYKAIPGTYTWQVTSDTDDLQDFSDKVVVIMSEYRNSRDIEGLSLDVEDMKGLLNKILNKLDELEQKIEDKPVCITPTTQGPLESLTETYKTLVTSDKAKAVKWITGWIWYVLVRTAAIGFLVGSYYVKYKLK